MIDFFFFASTFIPALSHWKLLPDLDCPFEWISLKSYVYWLAGNNARRRTPSVASNKDQLAKDDAELILYPAPLLRYCHPWGIWVKSIMT